MTVRADLTQEATRSRVVELRALRTSLSGDLPAKLFWQVRNHDRALNDPRNRLYQES